MIESHQSACVVSRPLGPCPVCHSTDKWFLYYSQGNHAVVECENCHLACSVAVFAPAVHDLYSGYDAQEFWFHNPNESTTGGKDYS